MGDAESPVSDARGLARRAEYTQRRSKVNGVNCLSVQNHLAILLACLLTGCASYRFSPQIAMVGDDGPNEALADEAADMSEVDAEKVKILLGRLPEGMRIIQGRLVVDEDRYRVLAAVRAVPDGSFAQNFGVWFYDYNEGEDWRTGYCAWQVPLSWLTLSLWAFVTPFHYPCKVAAGASDPRRDNIIRALARGTKAAGGNLLIVTGIGDLVTVRVDTGQVVDQEAAFVGTGIAVAYRSRSEGGWEKIPAGEEPPSAPSSPDDEPRPDTALLDDESPRRLQRR